MVYRLFLHRKTSHLPVLLFYLTPYFCTVIPSTNVFYVKSQIHIYSSVHLLKPAD